MSTETSGVGGSTPLDIVIEAAGKWRDELHNYVIPDADQAGAADYTKEADAISAAIDTLGKDTSINVYFTGDEDGPDLFGVVYDDEDGVLEAAHENEVHGWRVPVTPLLERAVRLDGDHDA